MRAGRTLRSRRYGMNEVNEVKQSVIAQAVSSKNKKPKEKI